MSQDLGNTNFSIMLPRLLFTRAHGAELVAEAIRTRLGVKQCTVNDRNDVIIRDGEKDLKMSCVPLSASSPITVQVAQLPRTQVVLLSKAPEAEKRC